MASIYYPGGSQASRNSVGYSWSHNYWCNLLAENAINGSLNTARPYAITSMVILCATLSSFWFLFAQYAGLKKNHRLLIQVPGTLSILTLVFVFPWWHDMGINIATSFGLVALGGVYTALFRLRWKVLFWTGMVQLLLVALNNIFYYNDDLMRFLPKIQQFTFIYFLVWIALVTIKLYQKQSSFTSGHLLNKA